MADPRFLNPITVLADIGGISIDVTKRVSEEYDTIISQNPIEDGSPSTDHVTNLPVKLTIQGGFSDIRLTNLIGPAITQEAFKGLAKTQFDKLLELKAARETFNVMDGLHLLKDMLIKNLKYIKEKEGFTVMFEMELWNIRIISLDRLGVGKKLQDIEDTTNRLLIAPQLLLSVGAVPVKTSTLEALESFGVLA